MLTWQTKKESNFHLVVQTIKYLVVKDAMSFISVTSKSQTLIDQCTDDQKLFYSVSIYCLMSFRIVDYESF